MEIKLNYQRCYKQLIQKARARTKPSGYLEKHHILPRSLGGGDDEFNIVHLTAREHYVAHLLLAKIHGGPMWRALFLMSSKLKTGSRMYNAAKAIFSLQQKEIGKRIGARNWANGVGLAALSKLEKEEIARKAGKKGGRIGGSNPSSLQSKIANGLKAKKLGTGIHAPGVSSKAGKKSGEVAKSSGQIYKLQLSVASLAGTASCKKRNSIRLICDTCGFSGNAGHQGKHRKRTGCNGKGVQNDS